jgi:hypothetical protein
MGAVNMGKIGIWVGAIGLTAVTLGLSFITAQSLIIKSALLVAAAFVGMLIGKKFIPF